MIEIRVALGEAADNFTDEQIALAYKKALVEVEDYCRREADAAMEYIAQDIAVIRLNRINTEGLTSQGFSGVSESYINDYPADIQKRLNRKRRIKVV